MRQRTKRVIKSLVGTVVFLSILLGILVQWAPLFRDKNQDAATLALLKGFYQLDENTCNIAVIGSSAVLRYDNPTLLYKLTGNTACHYVADCFPFEITVETIKEIQKTQSPQLYIIDLRRYYQEIRDERNGKNESEEHVNKMLSYFNAMIDSMPYSAYRTGIIHKLIESTYNKNEIDFQWEYLNTHTNWKDLTMTDVKEYFKELYFPGYKKEKYSLDMMGSMFKTTVEHQKPVDFTQYKKRIALTKEELAPLEEVISYIKENNLQALFVFTPYAIAEERYAFESYLTEYLASQGMNCLNCNDHIEEIGIDFYSDYYDSRHVNISGAIKFTEYLASYINNNCNLTPVNLTKEQKKLWEDEYQNFVKQSEAGLKSIAEKCEKDRNEE